MKFFLHHPLLFFFYLLGHNSGGFARNIPKKLCNNDFSCSGVNEWCHNLSTDFSQGSYCGTNTCEIINDCLDIGNFDSGVYIADGCFNGLCSYSTTQTISK